ncbi:MAG: amidase [Actinomycetota bacterium]
MPDDLCDRTATELARMLRSREVSARDVLDAHLARIEETNPAINAIVTVVPERAMDEAREADERLARGEAAGPLHGLPIAIKDLVQTAGIRTTFGSPIFADNVPATDDLLVQRVRAAGAVVIGKTNTAEWGAGSHTFNEVFGLTRNPYDRERSAGGSSGGAAAALATGMVPIADGSDLGGSLRNPASFCNVVGFRPSAGRVPTWPSIDTRDDLSVDGPMGRTVDDVAFLLSAIAGPDDRVPISRPEPGSVFTPPIEAAVTGTRIAWAPACGGTMPVEPEVVAVIDAARPVFEALACTTEDAFPDLRGAREAFLTLRAQMFAAALGPLLEHHRDRMKATVVWNIEMGLGQSAGDIAAAQAHRSVIDERTAAFFERFDAIAMPVSQVPPFPAELEYPNSVAGASMQTYLDWMESCWAISVTGLPAISVPCDFTDQGLPVGIQLVGRRWDDLGLLRLAKAFEEATGAGHRAPPR